MDLTPQISPQVIILITKVNIFLKGDLPHVSLSEISLTPKVSLKRHRGWGNFAAAANLAFNGTVVQPYLVKARFHGAKLTLRQPCRSLPNERDEERERCLFRDSFSHVQSGLQARLPSICRMNSRYSCPVPKTLNQATSPSGTVHSLQI